jgi:hypothetical protein
MREPFGDKFRVDKCADTVDDGEKKVDRQTERCTCNRLMSKRSFLNIVAISDNTNPYIYLNNEPDVYARVSFLPVSQYTVAVSMLDSGFCFE